jgi:hypothetical protein
MQDMSTMLEHFKAFNASAKTMQRRNVTGRFRFLRLFAVFSIPVGLCMVRQVQRDSHVPDMRVTHDVCVQLFYHFSFEYARNVEHSVVGQYHAVYKTYQRVVSCVDGSPCLMSGDHGIVWTREREELLCL